jgi:hypothetical protein
VDSDRVDGDECLRLRQAGDLEPGWAAAVAESVHRALGETADAWTRLSADPQLHPRLATVIRGALDQQRGPDGPEENR